MAFISLLKKPISSHYKEPVLSLALSKLKFASLDECQKKTWPVGWPSDVAILLASMHTRI